MEKTTEEHCSAMWTPRARPELVQCTPHAAKSVATKGEGATGEVSSWPMLSGGGSFECLSQWGACLATWATMVSSTYLDDKFDATNLEQKHSSHGGVLDRTMLSPRLRVGRTIFLKRFGLKWINA